MFFMVFVLFVHERHFLYIHDVFILKMLKNRHMSEKGEHNALNVKCIIRKSIKMADKMQKYS